MALARHHHSLYVVKITVRMQNLAAYSYKYNAAVGIEYSVVWITS
jgi:hypothetical protein